MAQRVFSFEADPKQWEAFFEVCKKIAPEVGQNAFRKTIEAGGKDVLARARSNLTSMTKGLGRLSRALKAKRTSKYEPNFWKTSIAVNTGKKRNDKSGAYYAHMVEFGHKLINKDGKVYGNVPPKPFLRSALEELSEPIVGSFKANVKKELEKAWSKIPKTGKTTVDFSDL